MNKTDTKLLGLVKEAVAKNEFHYANNNEMASLAKLGLVECNPAMKRDDGKLPWRLTTKGIQHMATAANTKTTTPAPAAKKTDEKTEFVIATVTLPAVKRNTGARGSKYPFDKLEVGGAFFIPSKDGDNKKASKSFGSMVSAANKRYKGERRFVTRSVPSGKELNKDWDDKPGIVIGRVEPKKADKK